MFRLTAVLAAAVVLCGGVALAQPRSEGLGVDVTAGVMQPSGGDADLAQSGLIAGLGVHKYLTDRLSVGFEYRHGETQAKEPSVASPGRFSSWGAADDFATVWNYAGVDARWNFMPDARTSPFVSAGVGLTFWEVQDWRATAAEQGGVPKGYDTDGELHDLEGADVTAALGAGIEYMATDHLAITAGGRYYYLFQNKLDNSGWSSVYGPGYVDANNSILEGYVGLSFYFGPSDCDGDGIFGSLDKCPRDPEDFDGFQDDDGCPDPDNDGDGILDVDDRCPDQPEDMNGIEDDDGCPDNDADGDGIIDVKDACPDEPEDIDGFQDQDGCPDPDNDGDGVLDSLDKCPDTPKGVVVDATGCEKKQAPQPAPATLMAATVHFDLNSAELRPEAKVTLDALAKALNADTSYKAEIDGYTCDLGTPDYNQALSERRAKAVRAYLVSKGVDADRLTVMAFGLKHPLVPNDSEAHRRENRRALITPSKS